MKTKANVSMIVKLFEKLTPADYVIIENEYNDLTADDPQTITRIVIYWNDKEDN
jgi:hypothetical protein